MPNLEIRAFDRTTGARLHFPDRDVLGADWEETDAGGVGRIAVRLAYKFDAADLPEAGSLLEIVNWDDPVMSGEIEPAPRARGLIMVHEPKLDTSETTTLTAYGLASDMGAVRLNNQLIEPGGTDLSWFAGQVLSSYLAARPWLTGRVTSLILDTGITREMVEMSDTDCRSALSQLASEGPGIVVWGWRVDPDVGVDQFVFGPRTSVVAEALAVGGQAIRSLSRPRDLSSVANAVWLTGGPTLYPNLLAPAVDGNTGFERAELADTITGNKLLNPGFEARFDNWSTRGSTDIKVGEYRYGPTRTGRWMGELTSNGEAFYQERTEALTVGKQIYFSVFARLGQGTDTKIGYLTFYFKDAGGTTLLSKSIPVAPASSLWEEFKGTITVPTGTAKWRWDCEATAGSGTLFVDDAVVRYANALRPRGWDVTTTGTAKFTATDPLYRGVSWQGASSLHVAGTFSGTGNRGVIRPAGSTRFAVQGDQTLIFAIRARRAPGFSGTSGAMRLELNDQKSAPASTVIASGQLTDDWKIFHHQQNLNPTATECLASIYLEGDTEILIDGVQVRDLAAGTPFLPTQPDSLEWIEADRFERLVLAEDVCTPGSPAYLSATQYDRRTVNLSAETVTKWDAATQAWMKAWFDANAPLPDPWSVSIDAQATRIDPLDGNLVRITNLDADLPDISVARASYRWGNAGSLDCSLEMDRRRPDLARMIAGGSKKPVSSGGGSSRSSGGVGGGSAQSLTLPVPVAQGGTGAMDAAGARANLGIGAQVSAVSATFDGGGSSPTVGTIGYVRVPYSGTITKASIFADVSGSAVVDVWKDVWANYPPTVAGTIAASAKPTLSSAIKAEDATLSGWTTAVTAGDVIAFKIDSCTTITRLSIALEITRSL
jgi:hypothetical protein